MVRIANPISLLEPLITQGVIPSGQFDKYADSAVLKLGHDSIFVSPDLLKSRVGWSLFLAVLFVLASISEYSLPLFSWVFRVWAAGLFVLAVFSWVKLRKTHGVEPILAIRDERLCLQSKVAFFLKDVIAITILESPQYLDRSAGKLYRGESYAMGLYVIVRGEKEVFLWHESGLIDEVSRSKITKLLQDGPLPLLQFNLDKDGEKKALHSIFQWWATSVSTDSIESLRSPPFCSLAAFRATTFPKHDPAEF